MSAAARRLFYGAKCPLERFALVAVGGDGEAVQLEKGYGVENCLECAQNPQRPVRAVLGGNLIADLGADFRQC